MLRQLRGRPGFRVADQSRMIDEVLLYFLHFKTMSEGMDDDLRYLSFLAFFKPQSYVVRENKELRARFGIQFLRLRTKWIRLRVEGIVLHRNRYPACVRVFINPGVCAEDGRVDLPH